MIRFRRKNLDETTKPSTHKTFTIGIIIHYI